ncbi:MAG: hypothetical protein NXI21_15440 [Alphaproteobacteria bacterium]|nr:hypothetical protein [Alphaproteobacteria bacterium]
MIGKLFKLLFLEKSARDRLAAARDAPKRPAGRIAPKGAPAPPQSQAPPQAPPQAPARPATATPADSDAAAIRAAIDAAHLEMTGAGAADAGRPADPDREAERRQLIRSALTVHKLKQSALDDLAPEDRARLRALAERMLGVDKR